MESSAVCEDILREGYRLYDEWEIMERFKMASDDNDAPEKQLKRGINNFAKQIFHTKFLTPLYPFVEHRIRNVSFRDIADTCLRLGMFSLDEPNLEDKLISFVISLNRSAQEYKSGGGLHLGFGGYKARANILFEFDNTNNAYKVYYQKLPNSKFIPD